MFQIHTRLGTVHEFTSICLKCMPNFMTIKLSFIHHWFLRKAPTNPREYVYKVSYVSMAALREGTMPIHSHGLANLLPVNCSEGQCYEAAVIGTIHQSWYSGVT